METVENTNNLTGEIQIPIHTVQWNHHTWCFTDENEAWKFADYWGLL